MRWYFGGGQTLESSGNAIQGANEDFSVLEVCLDEDIDVLNNVFPLKSESRTSAVRIGSGASLQPRRRGCSVARDQITVIKHQLPVTNRNAVAWVVIHLHARLLVAKPITHFIPSALL